MTDKELDDVENGSGDVHEAALMKMVAEYRELRRLIDEYDDEPVDRGDDWSPRDASGSNFDGAYYMGVSDGEQSLAYRIRQILSSKPTVADAGATQTLPDSSAGGTGAE